MNKKTGLSIITLILIIALFNLSTILAQELVWDEVTVSAYATNLEEIFPPVGSFTFTVVAPPGGSNIPNTISLLNYDSGENYTNSLSPGDEVIVGYLDFQVFTYNFSAASEPNHFIINYHGQGGVIRVNRQVIPEFPPILILPLFISVTLLAIFYRRKRVS